MTASWFADGGFVPPFATSTEIDSEYRRYMETITEEQWHGIRLGDNPGEVVILRERPGISERTDPADPFANLDWIDGDPVRIARFLLHGALPDDPDVGDIAVPFAEKIVSKLARGEWTLTFTFIRTWTDLIRRNT